MNNLESVITSSSVSSQIIEVLDNIAKRFGIFIDWSQANILPYLSDVLNRYIQFRMCSKFIWLIFFSLLFIVLLIMRKTIYKFFDDEYDFDSGLIVICIVLGFIFCIIGIMVNIIDIIKLNIIPEEFLMDQLTQYLKTRR